MCTISPFVGRSRHTHGFSREVRTFVLYTRCSQFYFYGSLVRRIVMPVTFWRHLQISTVANTPPFPYPPRRTLFRYDRPECGARAVHAVRDREAAASVVRSRGRPRGALERASAQGWRPHRCGPRCNGHGRPGSSRHRCRRGGGKRICRASD